VKFHAKPVVEVALKSAPRLGQKTKLLAAELRRLDAKDIKKQLHVNDALAKQYHEQLGKFEAQNPVQACCLYDSQLYKGLDASNFDEDDASWANKHVRIFSGLYGLLRPFDAIAPLSLPVALGTKLKNSKGNFLRDYWSDSVAKELEDGLNSLPLPVMINCAAEEDGASYAIERLPEGTIITNIEMKMADRQAAAEATGEFIRWALETRCQTVEELLEYRGSVEEDEPATMRISPKASGKNTIVFEPNKGDAGIGQKIADSGKSKRAFIKENASGKNKYMRTEINKSLKGDQKKAKKQYAVH